VRSRGRLLLALGATTLALRASAQTPDPAPVPSPSPVQTPAPSPPTLTLEVGVDVVSVTAVVFDKGGHFVKGLGPKDVQLAEDGVPQEVSYFREGAGPGEERIPLSVVLVLDTSGSMNRNLRFLQEAVLSFVYKLDELDSALVVSFNESVKASVEFTNDTDRLERFVDGLQAWGGTSLYDALHYSLGRIKDEPGRKAIVLFSDGADTTSSMRDQEVVDYARAVEATVYSIGFQGGGSGVFGGSAKGFLKKVADETGGDYFFPDKVGDLIRVFQAISSELKNHYLLAYSPKRAPDGRYRTISLKIPSRPELQVRVRKGYFAVKKRPPLRKRTD
jgi:Ca-activated chloride channel homolog